MARIFMDGFESGLPNFIGPADTTTGASNGLWKIYQRSEASSVYATHFVPSATAKDSVYGHNIYNEGPSRANAGYLYKDFPTSHNKLFIKFDFLCQTQEITRRIMFLRDASATEGMSLRWTTGTTPSLQLYNGTSLVSTISDIFLNSVWYRIELMYDADGSSIVVKIDGATYIEYTGSLLTSITTLCLGSPTYSDPNFNYYYDNVCVNDASGTVNNSWIGRTAIKLIKPNGNGALQDFTPTAGDAYTNVNEVPFSGTNYIQSSTFNNTSTFTLEDVLDAGAVINAVQPIQNGLYTDEVTSVASVLRIGGVNYEDTAEDVLNEFAKTQGGAIRETNPATSTSWTAAAIAAMEAGVKHIERV